MTMTMTRPSIGFPVDLFDFVNSDVQAPRPRSATYFARPAAKDPCIPPPRAEEDEERWDGLS